MPDDLATFSQPVDDHIKRGWFDARLQSAGGDPSLPQREIVGEHFNPGLHDVCMIFERP